MLNNLADQYSRTSYTSKPKLLDWSKHHNEQDTKTNLKDTKRYSFIEELLQTKAK